MAGIPLYPGAIRRQAGEESLAKGNKRYADDPNCLSMEVRQYEAEVPIDDDPNARINEGRFDEYKQATYEAKRPKLKGGWIAGVDLSWASWIGTGTWSPSS